MFRLIAATMATGATMIALTSHGGVTVLVVGGLFQQAYRERGLAPENLSRSLEDSVTITEPLMPWTVSGVFIATTLGVPTLAYAPWAVFCYLRAGVLSAHRGAVSSYATRAAWPLAMAMTNAVACLLPGHRLFAPIRRSRSRG